MSSLYQIKNKGRIQGMMSLFLLVLFFFPFVSHAERIKEFSTIMSNTASSSSAFNVSESIQYDFEGTSRHGIYRTIPLINLDGSKLSIDTIRVTDAAGEKQIPFATEYKNNNLEIKIGDPNKIVTGVQTYVLFYRVQNAMVSFTDYDELYWNVTGNEWNVPIDHAQIYLTINGTSLEKENIKQSACYQGREQSTDTCSIDFVSDINNHPIIAKVSNLSPQEGLTIAVGLQKGIISGILREGGKINTNANIPPKIPILDSIIVGLIILGSIYYRFFIIRDPRPKNPVVAWYEPPAGLSPIVIGTLIDKDVDGRDVTGQILSLAQRGYITITRIQDKKFGIFNSVDYIFEIIKDTTDVSFTGDRKTLGIVFGLENPPIGTKINLSQIKNQGAQTLFYKLKGVIQDILVSGGFVEKNNFMVVSLCIHGILILIAIHYFFLMQTGQGDIVANLIIFFGMVLSMMIIGKTPRKYTQLGVDTKQQILGFKEFLSVTDKDRFDFHNAPEKSPTQFMEYLPYAIVLGVEDKWAEQFKDITIPNPSWYTGAPGHLFVASEFANHMGGLGVTFASTVAPASSGSGGGGFSGGGSGGGGGGSW